MKQIYIILTYTGTMLSKIVRYYTKKKYSHVSIALDSQLNEMYSFGRLNPYNPFWGGFVHEKIQEGTFKRFKNTTAIIYSLEVTDEQYEQINKAIKKISFKRNMYKFNLIGLITIAVNLRIKRKYAFYCAEFVKYVIENGKIENELPEMIKPEDFLKLNNLRFKYEGILREYDKKEAV